MCFGHANALNKFFMGYIIMPITPKGKIAYTKVVVGLRESAVVVFCSNYSV